VSLGKTLDTIYDVLLNFIHLIEYAEVELGADVTNWFCVYDSKIRNTQALLLLESGESYGYAVFIINPTQSLAQPCSEAYHAPISRQFCNPRWQVTGLGRYKGEVYLYLCFTSPIQI
jgi:hypothetical protein